jgi:ketosteroid isomerase-like protein
MTETRLALATDKQEITEVIYRFARAIDRCDKQLIASVFHPGATDDHGSFKGTAEEFADWVIPLLETMQFTQHAIANVLIEVKGDRAFAESYFRAYHRISGADGEDRDLVAAGRYLDRFERRDGLWKINHRHCIFDWSTNEPATDDAWKSPKTPLERGQRGTGDGSYVDRNEYLGV